MRYIDLRAFRERFTPACQRAISASFDLAVGMGHTCMEPVHLLHGCTQSGESVMEELVAGFGVPYDVFAASMDEALAQLPRKAPQPEDHAGLELSEETVRAFHLALEHTHRQGSSNISVRDLAIGSVRSESDGVVSVLNSIQLASELVVRALSAAEESEDAVDAKRYELPTYLGQFATNLNYRIARDGAKPLIGRDDEIRQMVEGLCHLERSNSVMLLGEAGVGKTAMAEGLANLLETEDESIPAPLRGKQIVELHLNSLVAGTMFRGMFEDRIDKILKELREFPQYILFIDEAHNLVGAGSAMGVPSDAANILKSALARGEIQVIGATTLTEYRRFVQEDEALSRRFRTVRVDEPSIEVTREILTGIRSHLTDLYGVGISDTVVDQALDLSDRYKHTHRRPDKVIGWLNTACVREQIAGHEDVAIDTLLGTVSDDVGVPKQFVARAAETQMSKLADQMRQDVVAQSEAIERVTSRLRLNKGPLKENYARPDGVFLFLGPTGVGKTEVARSLAKNLFGDARSMLRIDMSEFQAGGLSVDKLIGMPRGIVGSDMGGVLTTRVQEQPYSVILLDEIEKADRSVLNLFLQVFDEGWCTDGRGKRTYFSDTIIVMTSNLGTDSMRKLEQPLGFGGQTDVAGREVMQEAERFLSPELLNRIDDVVVFHALEPTHVEEIARHYVASIIERAASQGKTVKIAKSAIPVLASKGYSRKFGARPLKRMIDRLVRLPLTTLWNEADTFKVSAKAGEILVTPQAPKS